MTSNDTPIIPRVLNKYKDLVPPDAINIMRPSVWGNPYRIGYKTREECIAAYPEYLYTNLHGVALLMNIKLLRDKDLVCCCKPLPCHGDILLEFANLYEFSFVPPSSVTCRACGKTAQGINPYSIKHSVTCHGLYDVFHR